MSKLSLKKHLFLIGLIAAFIGGAFIIKAKRNQIKTIHSAELLEYVLNEGSHIIIGNTDAQTTLFMFYDYHCKACRFFFKNEYATIKNKFVDTGQLQLVLKPISLHNTPETEDAYRFLNCLSYMGIFEELHEILLLDHNYVFTKEFNEFKNKLIVENQELAQCVTASNYNAISINKEQWKKLNFSSVPIFILGNKIYKGNIKPQDIKGFINDK